MAQAHAPEARRVAATSQGALALGLPGFGVVFRAQPEQLFSYICDALLFPRATATAPSMVFQADGSLLLAGAGGVRIVGRDGCPLPAASSNLYEAEVVALASHDGTSTAAYAVATGSFAGLWRSLDGGRHWELRSQLEGAELVTAIVVSPTEPGRVYLSQTSAQGSVVLVSSDGGANLTRHVQEVARTLLQVQAGSERLWAWARDAQSTGNRGFAILRAETPEGPWQPLLRVAYLGGFAIDPEGVITVGDELGGVFRSEDDGASFQHASPELPVACLGQAGASLWACTPGNQQLPALQRIDRGPPFTPVVTLANVEQLVSCAPELEVERVCAAAWVEWQRDVLLRALPGPDAGVPLASEDAGQDSSGVDAEAQADAGAPSAPPAAGGSCAVASGAASQRGAALLALVLSACVLLAGRARNRRRRDA